MSSEVVNDENQGALPARKRVLSESAADIFALDQPTGRPSILRQSQAENVNKNIPKGVKVCFQTPLRDPVTRKIMSPSRVGKMAALDDCTNALESLTLKSPIPVDVPAKTATSLPDDDMPIQSRGGYAIDFDNLDSINPFQSCSKMILSPLKPAALLSDSLSLTEPAPPAPSPAPEEAEKLPEKADMALDETLPFIPSVENSLADLSADGASTDSTVIIEPRKTAPADHGADDTVNVEVPEPAPVVHEDVTDSLLLPKGSYSIDFDNLDSVNPFSAGGSKIQNSPPVSRKSPVRNPAPPQAEETSSGVKTPSEREDNLCTMEKPSLTEANADTALASAAPPTEAPVVLEFNFDDGAEVKRKPPPKRLGLKKPPLSKTKPDATKPASASAPAEKKSPKSNPSHATRRRRFLQREALTLLTLINSMIQTLIRSVRRQKWVDLLLAALRWRARSLRVQRRTRRTRKTLWRTTHTVLLPLNPKSLQKLNHLSLRKQKNPSPYCLPKPTSPPLRLFHSHKRRRSRLSPALRSTVAEFDAAAADDEFVPGSMFMPSDLDGQIDYLEQFGSSTFKESALRKQSLYLKFDPLLKESPKKATVDSSSFGFSLPRPSLAIRMMEAARSEVKQKSQQESTKLLEDFPPPAERPVVQDPAVLDLLVPTLKQTQRSEDVIVDMLKYTQKDLDAALEKTRKQAEEKEVDLKAQIEKMTLDNQHIWLIVSEFEAVIAQITAEHKQKDELAQAELSRVLQEKQQLAKELSDMERSFSDVVKHLDRRKEVIDGFKKNEETLKQCAQSYLARLQKEEQRYQMLKTHAEEKIDQANKQIAEVRSKLGAEVSALQVQLRREQLKVQSLEKNLEQKTKEVEDVTKLCDELIAKVQQH
ncbi:hypothetical protein PHYPO_G00184440 [Pangasianodon hypophthalmus]|uniref:Transforming acidic coiled-coil-containing protein C-terminal domain-containing protein n=1 Tax=Pangasianodon hypophthalmus TaxID=310915 RepID=A0A5N5PSK6_PANHP|nr:hypothetical protein PHYPO_G00184440 [Pangasianodon hypophthalmus]